MSMMAIKGKPLSELGIDEGEVRLITDGSNVDNVLGKADQATAAFDGIIVPASVTITPMTGRTGRDEA